MADITDDAAMVEAALSDREERSAHCAYSDIVIGIDERVLIIDERVITGRIAAQYCLPAKSDSG